MLLWVDLFLALGLHVRAVHTSHSLETPTLTDWLTP